MTKLLLSTNYSDQNSYGRIKVIDLDSASPTPTDLWSGIYTMSFDYIPEENVLYSGDSVQGDIRIYDLTAIAQGDPNASRVLFPPAEEPPNPLIIKVRTRKVPGGGRRVYYLLAPDGSITSQPHSYQFIFYLDDSNRPVLYYIIDNVQFPCPPCTAGDPDRPLMIGEFSFDGENNILYLATGNFSTSRIFKVSGATLDGPVTGAPTALYTPGSPEIGLHYEAGSLYYFLQDLCDNKIYINQLDLATSPPTLIPRCHFMPSQFGPPAPPGTLEMVWDLSTAPATVKKHVQLLGSTIRTSQIANIEQGWLKFMKSEITAEIPRPRPEPRRASKNRRSRR